MRSNLAFFAVGVASYSLAEYKAPMARVPPSFRKTTIPDAATANSPNMLKDSFDLSEPNQVWVTDITYVATREGWVYLCVFIDLYSRKVVGWAIDDNMRADLVIKAFEMAYRCRKPTHGLVVHSDCGGQYKSTRFRRLLWKRKVKQSMTHAGNCYDNAYAESFFSTLKKDLIRGVKFEARESAKSAMFEYIEAFYNRRRLHSGLDYKSPEQFENEIA